MTFFLLHFAFILKNFKNDQNNRKYLQEIYDFNFRQLELSIREIGYGDQSINKKMKDYINLFHGPWYLKYIFGITITKLDGKIEKNILIF